MKREILFRGKRVDNGEWIEGFYAECKDRSFISQESVEQMGSGFQTMCVCGETQTTNFCILGRFYEVVPETVGRYTGLTDRNGVRIFEGDFIVCRQPICGNFIDEHIERGYVEMKHGAFGLHRKQGYYRPFKDWLEDYEYEVIGNVHDNPELLKGEENNV